MRSGGNSATLCIVQSPLDPQENARLLDELVAGGIAALVAERIVDPTGGRTRTEAAAQTGGGDRRPAFDERDVDGGAHADPTG